MSWSIAEPSLAAASVSGSPVTGTSVDLAEVRVTHAAQVTVAGISGRGSLNVALWGSLDNANWYFLSGISGFSNPGSVILVSSGVQPAQYVQVIASPSGSYSATVSALVTSE